MNPGDKIRFRSLEGLYIASGETVEGWELAKIQLFGISGKLWVDKTLVHLMNNPNFNQSYFNSAGNYATGTPIDQYGGVDYTRDQSEYATPPATPPPPLPNQEDISAEVQARIAAIGQTYQQAYQPATMTVPLRFVVTIDLHLNIHAGGQGVKPNGN